MNEINENISFNMGVKSADQFHMRMISEMYEKRCKIAKDELQQCEYKQN